MPNVGKPSKDCHLCRSRRVKCDLGRPSCQRCIKYGAECPGYRDQQDLVFRSQDPGSTGAQKRQKKRAPVAAPRGHTSPQPESGRSTPFSSWAGDSRNGSDEGIPITELVRASGLTVPRSLPEHWTSHSVPIILNVYSSTEFLDHIYKAYSTDGPLVWVAHLFSRTYVTNLRYPTSIRKEALAETQKELGGYLGKTLSTVNQALSAPGGELRDDILATVWLLSNYELLVGSIAPGILSPWHMHTRGLYAMLQKRGVNGLRHEYNRGLFWAAYNMVQTQALITSTECPPESDEWFEVIRKNPVDRENIALLISSFSCKAARIQCRMLEIVRSGDFELAAANYVPLMTELTDAEEEAEMAFAMNPDPFDVLDTFFRKMYCATLVKVYHIAQLMTNFLTHYTAGCPLPPEQMKEQRDYCVHRTRTAAQEILDFAPRALNPTAEFKDKSPRALFDALKLVWPLTSVYIISSTLPDQKAQAEMYMFYIGRELGIRQALHTYPGSSGSRVPPQAHEPLGIGDCEEVDWVGRLR